MRTLAAVLLFSCFALGQHDHVHPDTNAQTGSNTPTSQSADSAMSTHHQHSSEHMRMTPLRPPHAGDKERGDQIVQRARAAMEHYQDYRTAEADGYHIFLPEVPQPMYHFTNWRYGAAASFGFDPDKPTSLLYEKTGDGYKLIGAMYTAPADATEKELDERVPLSVAQWHLHTNMCVPPKGREREYFIPHPQFGLNGSINTRAACTAAGGHFMPHVFGWMVHVYPFEKNAADVWSVERQMQDHL
jgi:hypothetical protein